MNSFAIQGNVVTEDQILENHFLVVEQGIIQSLCSTPPDEKYPMLDMRGAYILPGFRDQHIHDIQGQLAAGYPTHEASEERFQTVCRALAKQGVTGVYLAAFGGPLEQLIGYGEAARRWMEDPENGASGARLLGIHIEGTFINQDLRGAQPAEFCLIPGRDDCNTALNRLCDTGAVRIVNIVPDYGKPSLELIRRARDLGLLVGAGHINSSADLLRAAMEEYGLQFLVHFTNGPTGQSFKPFNGGGTFEGGLDLPIPKELIVDGFHIDFRYVLDLRRRTQERWGTDRILTVTDGIFPVAESIPQGEFAIGTTLARRSETGDYLKTVAYLQPDGSRKPAPPNTLCSSVLTMDKAFSNWVNYLTDDTQGHWYDHRALPLADAVIKASGLCATHQSKLDGEYAVTGSIGEGKWADLTVGRWIEEKEKYQFQVEKVYVRGVRVI